MPLPAPHSSAVFFTSTKGLLFITVFQFRHQKTLQLKPQSNEHFSQYPVFFLAFVFFAPLLLHFCRVLRTLIPITTKRAIRLSGQDPVHSAADGGQVECLRLLIQSGYDVNALLDTHISGTRAQSHMNLSIKIACWSR